MLNRVSTFHFFLAPDPSVLILWFIFLPKTEPGETSYAVPTAESVTCVWVSWQDQLVLWVARHYHISPAGESTCCRELLNVCCERQIIRRRKRFDQKDISVFCLSPWCGNRMHDVWLRFWRRLSMMESFVIRSRVNPYRTNVENRVSS